MHKRTRWLLLVAAFGAVLTGCSVKMNQLETAKRLVPAIQQSLRGSGDAQTAQAYAWEFSFNGATFDVYPTRISGNRITFRNRYNAEIIWDGVSLIVIKGFPGALGKYEQGVEGLIRWYAQDGKPTVRINCAPIYRWQLTLDQSGWRQRCSGVSESVDVVTEHSAEFDRNGILREIRSSLIPSVEPAVLRRKQRP